MANEFDQLLPCAWRDIQFPVTSVEVSFQQDLAEHKYFGVDGARVEATGRGALNITVTIPLVNGIVPGKNEKWGELYPETFRVLLRAAADRKAGVFTHPELDEITCRVRSVSFRHDAHKRDGVEMVVQFVETLIDFDQSEIARGDSPVSSAELGALDLDASKDDLSVLVPDAYELPYSLNDFIDSLTAIGDQFSIQSKLAFGKIGATVYHLGRLQDSVERARSAATWPVLDAIQKTKSALRWLEEHPPAGLPVKIYDVKEDISLAALVGEIPGAQLGDILKLNPGIMSVAIVRSGTHVRYHDRR